MFIIYVIDLSTKNFYKNQKIQTVGKRKNLFSVILFEKFLFAHISGFFFRKCLMFRSIYLNSTLFRPEILLCKSLNKYLKVKVHKMFRPQMIIYVPTFIYP